MVYRGIPWYTLFLEAFVICATIHAGCALVDPHPIAAGGMQPSPILSSHYLSAQIGTMSKFWIDHQRV